MSVSASTAVFLKDPLSRRLLPPLSTCANVIYLPKNSSDSLRKLHCLDPLVIAQNPLNNLAAEDKCKRILFSNCGRSNYTIPSFRAGTISFLNSIHSIYQNAIHFAKPFTHTFSNLKIRNKILFSKQNKL